MTDKVREALRAIIDTLDAEEMGEGPPASEHVAHWQKLHDDAQSALAAIDAAQDGGDVPKVKALALEKIAEVRSQLAINVSIAKRDHPEGPFVNGSRIEGVCHSQEILASHITDRLNELVSILSTLEGGTHDE